MKNKLTINQKLTPINAPDKGYEWACDVIYDPEAPKGAMDNIEKAVLKDKCLLGRPVSTATTIFVGLYRKI